MIKLNLRILFFIVIGLAVGSLAIAQSLKEADALFSSKEFTKAKEMYSLLQKKAPNDVALCFKLAQCNYELKSYATALKQFETLAKKSPLANWYLGDIYRKMYLFDEALLSYQAYLTTSELDEKRMLDTQAKMKQVELAKGLFERTVDVTIVDSMVVDKHNFLSFYNKSRELGAIKQDRVRLNQTLMHADKVEFTTERGDRRYFSENNNGNMDILKSYKLLDQWTSPEPISSNINTKANENYPFLLLDGVTMYFSSDGENSIGGYDIFVTKYSSSANDFLTPENIGMPFNSPFNDYMMVIDEQENNGWFVTDRFQASDKVVVYQFVYSDARTVCKVEDIELLRQYASLKTYKVAPKPIVASKTTGMLFSERAVEQLNVVLGDSIIYHSLDEFRNPIALKLMNEWKISLEQLNKDKAMLETLRNQYALMEDTVAMATLGRELLFKEEQLIQEEKTLNEKYIEACNQEITFILQ